LIRFNNGSKSEKELQFLLSSNHGKFGAHKKNLTIAFHVVTWPIVTQPLVMVLFKQPNLWRCSTKGFEYYHCDVCLQGITKSYALKQFKASI
jgi:hypothetical protein